MPANWLHGLALLLSTNWTDCHRCPKNRVRSIQIERKYQISKTILPKDDNCPWGRRTRLVRLFFRSQKSYFLNFKQKYNEAHLNVLKIKNNITHHSRVRKSATPIANHRENIRNKKNIRTSKRKYEHQKEYGTNLSEITRGSSTINQRKRRIFFNTNITIRQIIEIVCPKLWKTK